MRHISRTDRNINLRSTTLIGRVDSCYGRKSTSEGRIRYNESSYWQKRKVNGASGPKMRGAMVIKPDDNKDGSREFPPVVADGAGNERLRS